jgi:hypothetical protein
MQPRKDWGFVELACSNDRGREQMKKKSQRKTDSLLG